MAATLLLVLLLLAVATDVLYRRISNILICIGLVLGLALHIAAAGGDSSATLSAIASSLGGLGLGFLCAFPLYYLRAMGAGDVKLLMVVGVFLGPLPTLKVILFTFMAGGALAVINVLSRRSLTTLVANIQFMLASNAMRAAGVAVPSDTSLRNTAGRIPYAVAIFLGTLCQLWLADGGS